MDEGKKSSDSPLEKGRKRQLGSCCVVCPLRGSGVHCMLDVSVWGGLYHDHLQKLSFQFGLA